jgi:hypothetical protein
MGPRVGSPPLVATYRYSPASDRAR